jgi:hypothetical protein
MSGCGTGGRERAGIQVTNKIWAWWDIPVIPALGRLR